MAEINIREIAKELESGEPCNLLQALNSMSYGEKIRTLNDLVSANQSDRAIDPNLPEFKLSKSMSEDQQGVPVGKLQLDVRGVVNYESNLHLSTGSVTGISTMNRQCSLGGIFKEPGSMEEYRKEQEEFKNAVSQLENGHPEKFVNIILGLNFESTIRAFNNALKINQSDRENSPQLPEIKLEKKMSPDAAGVPVAEIRMSVPGVFNAGCELSMKSGRTGCGGGG